MATYTPKYPYDELGTEFNQEWLNTLNGNFDKVEEDLRNLLAYTNASLTEIRADIASWKAEITVTINDFKTYVNGKVAELQSSFDSLSKYVKDKVAEFENLTGFVVWKNPVANFAALATTYQSPVRGWTAQTLDDNKVYYFDGSAWTWALQYGVGNFNPYVFIEPAELKASITAIAARAGA